MNVDFHPARMRGVGAALLDVIFAMAVMATLAIAVLTVVNNGARDELARAYARQFRLATEDACPAAFGKSFWFVCASEVRRTYPRAEVSPDQPSPAAPGSRAQGPPKTDSRTSP